MKKLLFTLIRIAPVNEIILTNMAGFFERKKSILLFLLYLICASGMSQDHRRWQIEPDGSITGLVNNTAPHADHIEMSGKKISCCLAQNEYSASARIWKGPGYNCGAVRI